jgi:acyl-CoA thioester hydrolase
MVERGVDAVVAEANVRFRAPARYDEVIRLEARIARLGTTSITTTIDVVRDGDLLVEGSLRHVFVDVGSWDRTQMPDWIRAGLEPFAAAEGA